MAAVGPGAYPDSPPGLRAHDMPWSLDDHDAAALAAAIDTLVRSGASDVVLDAGDGRAAHLPRTLRHARDAGLKVALVVPPALFGRAAIARLLCDAGMVHAVLRRAPDDARDAAARAIQAAGGRPGVWLDTAADVDALRWAATSRVDAWGRPTTPAALDAWVSGARAHRVRLRLLGPGMAWPTPGAHTPAPPDPGVGSRVVDGFLATQDLAGCVATRDPAAWTAADEAGDLSWRLGALGLPARDLPACVGGTDDVAPVGPREHAPACAPCPRVTRCAGAPATWRDRVRPAPAWRGAARPARVALVDLGTPDRLLAASTLPALAAALRDQGAQVRTVSAWHPRTDLRALRETTPWTAAWRRWRQGDRTLGDPLRTAPDPDRARAVAARLTADLRLDDVDTVVVIGTPSAAALMRDAPLRPSARVLLADWHMLEAADAATVARTRGVDLTIHACFPRYATLYARRGVDLRGIGWRPYPVHVGHLAGPDPRHGAHILAGGGHARDPALLDALTRRLGRRTHPLHLLGPLAADLAGRPGVRALGDVPLPVYLRAIATSRFAVIALHDIPQRASGITMAAAALAAGRPVVATRTAAMIDHVEDGVSGLLVPPGDPEALADAIARLSADDALLARLSAGARAASRRIAVDAWASDILHGLPAEAPRCGNDGYYRAW